MPSFGEKLKLEREKRSITLEEISLSTKIGTRMLQALEDDKFSQLPGGIFNKGFVRAYARCLGIDEDQAVADYLEASGEGLPRPVESEAVASRAPEPTFSSSSRELPWGVFAATLLVVALALSIWTYHKRQRREMQVASPAVPAATQEAPPAQPPTLANSGSSAARAAQPVDAAIPNPEPLKAVVTEKPAAPPRATPPLASTPSLASAPPALRPHVATPAATPPIANPPLTASAEASGAAAAGGFTVLVQAREDSWIVITSDGKPLASYLLTAGSRRTVHGHQEVIVKAGNAGGVDFLFNGKKLPPQGESGQVRTLTFGAGGLQKNASAPVVAP